MNSGIYVINKDFKKIKKNIFSFENEILENLLKRKKSWEKKLIILI